MIERCQPTRTIEEVKPSSCEWTPTQIKQEFQHQLLSLSQQIEEPSLTMTNRDMRFVTPEQMRPKTDAERQQLIHGYGDYIADGGAGDCTLNDDGTYTLRIGCSGQEKAMSKNDVLQLMAHEYGHTLGQQFLESPILEELKAYAFVSLYMKHFYNLVSFQIIPDDVSNLHDKALLILQKLLNSGLKEEAIIARLTGESFGSYEPYDYPELLKKDDSSYAVVEI